MPEGSLSNQETASLFVRAKKTGKRPKLRSFPALSLGSQLFPSLPIYSVPICTETANTATKMNSHTLSTLSWVGSCQSLPRPFSVLSPGQYKTHVFEALFSFPFFLSYSQLVDEYSLTSKNEWAPLSLIKGGPRILRSQERETQTISQGFQRSPDLGPNIQGSPPSPQSHKGSQLSWERDYYADSIYDILLIPCKPPWGKYHYALIYMRKLSSVKLSGLSKVM